MTPPPEARARRHNDYDRYIANEFVPLVRARLACEGRHGQKFMATGCSLGAYHAANFFFRHPDIFDTVIALSGPYSAKFSVGDFMNEDVYMNSPLSYLPNLTDPAYLEPLRQSEIIIATGQGRWEEEIIPETRALQAILESKNIPAWVDFWGYDVDHDWPWWRIQMPYFLSHLPNLKPAAPFSLQDP
ncbi:alpha/beta hydrolase-fold protein [Heliophilum fasciatum]|uniref:Putative esterase n=2 Tax=Heliophilum fasciatum TaxID=35700 RepID=A0A4R2RME2_9FIRM|nr:alpha/beta hydrolase-fold protein [Heliophilum fasciatum]MCW2277560.1 esterase/lipase superfamily enzyme [Heliophilum fasciatum]TCP65150.1 putative esterase [Heliophilum fasciatum]